MTSDEVWDLLGIIAAGDHRTLGEADGKIWSATVGDLPFNDACEAVAEHFRESTDWITPAHVRQRVKAMRVARIDRAAPITPPPDAAESPAKYQAFLRAAVRHVADGTSVHRALGPAPLPGEPPEEWKKARDAIEPLRRDKRADALKQVAESRKQRLADLDKPGGAS